MIMQGDLEFNLLSREHSWLDALFCGRLRPALRWSEWCSSPSDSTGGSFLTGNATTRAAEPQTSVQSRIDLVQEDGRKRNAPPPPPPPCKRMAPASIRNKTRSAVPYEACSTKRLHMLGPLAARDKTVCELTPCYIIFVTCL